MQSRTSIIGKSAILSAVIVLFIFGCGGSFNPLTWNTQIERLVSPQQLVQPEKVGEFYAEMEKQTGSNPAKMFEFISSEIQYTNDFSNYAAINHLATAEEVLLSRQDDCDGQAVLLCSVLRYAGYEAYTVIGYSHAWVEVEMEETLLIDYRGEDWYVRFNESSVEWRVTSFLLLAIEEFLFLMLFFSIVMYSYEKGFLTYLQEVLGFFKYVFLPLLICVVAVVIVVRFWVMGTLALFVSVLLIMEIIARLRK